MLCSGSAIIFSPNTRFLLNCSEREIILAHNRSSKRSKRSKISESKELADINRGGLADHVVAIYDILTFEVSTDREEG